MLSGWVWHTQHLDMKIFFPPVISIWWGDIIGSEKSKKFHPKVGFHPKSSFKSSQFLVISLIYTPCGQWTDHEVLSIRVITKNWWILEKKFGSKTTFGFRFFRFFTSRKLPPTWGIDGWKNFKIPKSSDVIKCVVKWHFVTGMKILRAQQEIVLTEKFDGENVMYGKYGKTCFHSVDERCTWPYTSRVVH